jgi:uncharacterized protein (TIGR02996 family)
MRTFQFSDAKSHKFWNIEVTGTRYEVQFGKVGSAGQRQRKTFATAAEAQADADRLVKEKLKKGYIETSPKAAASEAEAFESALQANPDDLAGWCAYADYLVEHGDPQGEFMQTQIALEDAKLSKSARTALQKKEAELLKKHEAEWVGDWPKLYAEPTNTEGRGQINHTGGKKYEFKRGVLAAVHFGDLTVAAARAFVKSPQTRFVRELFIGYYAWDEEFEEGADIPEGVDSEDEAAGHVLLRWPYMRHVRRFQYGWAADEVYGDFCNFQSHMRGDLVYDFVKQMPDVEEVLIFAHLDDATKLAALPLPKLRVLQLYHGWSIPLEKLAKNPSLTNLTHLLCHPHALESSDEPYIRLPGLKAVCRSPHLTSLTHLRLRLADFGDDGIREIIASGILKRLKVLDLRHGCVTDEGAKALAACPDLKNLQHLDLSRNRLTDEGVKALKATKVPVDLVHQRPLKGTEDAYEQQQYLFEADYE